MDLDNSQRQKDYVYASSRVRSVEKTLLNRDRTESLIECKFPADALKILYEAGYGEGTEPLPSERFEELLAAETRKSCAFIRSIAPDHRDLYPMFYQYDYHNLRVLLKAEFLQTEADSFLIDNGTIPAAKLADMVMNRDFVGMTPIMKAAVLEVLDVFARTQDPQTIDFIMDRAFFQEIRESAAQAGSEFLKGYVSLLIDITNLKTFVRLRQMKKSWDAFTHVYIDGGRIQEKLFVASFDEPFEQFTEKMVPYGLKEAMEAGGAMLRESGRFTALERACDDRIMAYAKEAKYISFGLEPLIAYLIAKESEIRNVRIALTGLIQGLSRDMMVERLRETYV